jgi:hypothetical protein
VSNLPRRPNIGGRGDLEAFYHVQREEGEILHPPGTLWRQRYGDHETVSYRPLWVEIAGNFIDPLRGCSPGVGGGGDDDDDDYAGVDKYGTVGMPILYTNDETMEPDEDGHQYRRWLPLQVLANGGYGVCITYMDASRGFTLNDDIADEDKIVAKFNYKDGDLVDILASVIDKISIVSRLGRGSMVARRAARAARMARMARAAPEVGQGNGQFNR